MNCMDLIVSSSGGNAGRAKHDEFLAYFSQQNRLPPLIMEAAAKVDKCLARLQALQSTVTIPAAPMSPSISACLSPERIRSRTCLPGSPKVQPEDTKIRIHDILRWSDDCSGNTRQERRDKYLRRLARSKTEVFDEKKDPRDPHGEWKHWSSPAGDVHKVITEVLMASQMAKELSSMAKAAMVRTDARSDDAKSNASKRSASTSRSGLDSKSSSKKRAAWEIASNCLSGSDDSPSSARKRSAKEIGSHSLASSDDAKSNANNQPGKEIAACPASSDDAKFSANKRPGKDTAASSPTSSDDAKSSANNRFGKEISASFLSREIAASPTNSGDPKSSTIKRSGNEVATSFLAREKATSTLASSNDAKWSAKGWSGKENAGSSLAREIAAFSRATSDNATSSATKRSGKENAGSFLSRETAASSLASSGDAKLNAYKGSGKENAGSFLFREIAASSLARTDDGKPGACKRSGKEIAASYLVRETASSDNANPSANKRVGKEVGASFLPREIASLANSNQAKLSAYNLCGREIAASSLHREIGASTLASSDDAKPIGTKRSGKENAASFLPREIAASSLASADDAKSSGCKLSDREIAASCHLTEFALASSDDAKSSACKRLGKETAASSLNKEIAASSLAKATVASLQERTRERSRERIRETATSSNPRTSHKPSKESVTNAGHKSSKENATNASRKPMKENTASARTSHNYSNVSSNVTASQHAHHKRDDPLHRFRVVVGSDGPVKRGSNASNKKESLYPKSEQVLDLVRPTGDTQQASSTAKKMQSRRSPRTSGVHPDIWTAQEITNREPVQESTNIVYANENLPRSVRGDRSLRPEVVGKPEVVSITKLSGVKASSVKKRNKNSGATLHSLEISRLDICSTPLTRTLNRRVSPYDGVVMPLPEKVVNEQILDSSQIPIPSRTAEIRTRGLVPATVEGKRGAESLAAVPSNGKTCEQSPQPKSVEGRPQRRAKPLIGSLRHKFVMETAEIKNAANNKPLSTNQDEGVLVPKPTFAPGSPPGSRPASAHGRRGPSAPSSPVRSSSTTRRVLDKIGQVLNSGRRSMSPEITRRLNSTRRKLMSLSPARNLPSLISKLPSARKKSSSTTPLNILRTTPSRTRPATPSAELPLPPGRKVQQLADEQRYRPTIIDHTSIAQHLMRDPVPASPVCETELIPAAPFCESPRVFTVRQLRDLDCNAQSQSQVTVRARAPRKESHLRSHSESDWENEVGVLGVLSSCRKWVEESEPPLPVALRYIEAENVPSAVERPQPKNKKAFGAVLPQRENVGSAPEKPRMVKAASAAMRPQKENIAPNGWENEPGVIGVLSAYRKKFEDNVVRVFEENAVGPGCATPAALRKSWSTGSRSLSTGKVRTAGSAFLKKARDWMRTQTPYRDRPQRVI